MFLFYIELSTYYNPSSSRNYPICARQGRRFFPNWSCVLQEWRSYGQSISLRDKRALAGCFYLLAAGSRDEGTSDGRSPALCLCIGLYSSRARSRTRDRDQGDPEQYRNIDVLVTVGNIHVIIEDKTYTNVHSNQIDVYTNALIQSGVPKEDIRTVFYKIVEQFHEEDVDCAFTRADILEMLRKYKDCNSDIFQSYLAHLEEIKSNTAAFKTRPIEEWKYEGTRGFFANLQKEHADYKINGWGYVSNASGGFMGMWFHRLDDEMTLKAMGIYEHIEDIYLQFENNTAFSGSREEAEKAAAYIIAVKVRASAADQKDNYRDGSEIRRALYESLRNKLPDFKKKTFRPGIYMTVGYLTYNENNYNARVSEVKRALNEIAAEWSQR